MVYRKSATMPLIFCVNGVDQQRRGVTHSPTPTPTPTTTTSSSSSLYIKRFTMFQNLQNTKPCSSCGGG